MRDPALLLSAREKVRGCTLGQKPPRSEELVAAGNIPAATPAQGSPWDAPHGTLLLPGLSLPLLSRNGPATLDTARIRSAAPQLARILRHERPAPVRPKRVGGVVFVSGGCEASRSSAIVGTTRLGHTSLTPPSRAVAPPDHHTPVVTTIAIEYRDVVVRLDNNFVFEYLCDLSVMLYEVDEFGTVTKVAVPAATGYGMVSSVDDALRNLWAPLMGEARGDFSVLRGTIGCYNLPKEPTGTELFYATRWGSPGFAVDYTLQLLYTYVDYVRPEVGPCQGLSAFIKEAFDAARDDEDTDPRAVADASGDPSHTCTTTSLFNFVSYDVEMFGTFAENSRATNALTIGEMRTLFHASDYGFLGFVCDDILFRARLLMDASLYDTSYAGSRSALLEAAEHIARYALRLLVAYAVQMIHKLGHTWLDDTVCAQPHAVNRVALLVAIAALPFACSRSCSSKTDKGGGHSDTGCPDLYYTTCESELQYMCDTCDHMYKCSHVGSGGQPLRWMDGLWPCECIDADGNLQLYDTATHTGDTACRYTE